MTGRIMILSDELCRNLEGLPELISSTVERLDADRERRRFIDALADGDRTRIDLLRDLALRRTVFIVGEAGSGKSDLLARGYAFLVALGTDPGRILAPSVVARAAAAMAMRARAILEAIAAPHEARDWITTFTSAAFRILRAESIPRDVIADPVGEAVALLERERDSVRAPDRFDAILLDDAEDLTPLQRRFIALLRSESCGLAIAGDPDAGIAAWRGADGRGLEHFMKAHPDARTARLDRLTPAREVTAAVRSIRRARHVEPGSNGGVRVAELRNGREEASFVAGAVHDRLRAGADPARVAVMARLHHILDTVAETLRDTGLRCAKPPRAGSRMADSWIAPVALMETVALAARTESLMPPADDAAFAAALSTALTACGAPPHRAAFPPMMRERFLDAARRAHDLDAIDGSARSALERVAAFADDAARRPIWTPPAMLEEALRFHPADDAETLRAFARSVRVERIADGVERILEFTRRARERFGGWGEDGDPFDDSSGVSVIRLLTFHAAKGRSFDHVFIAGCEDGSTPCLAGAAGMSESELLAEERRLLYVGASCARRELVFTWAERREHNGEERRNRLSRFLAELPGEIALRERVGR